MRDAVQLSKLYYGCDPAYTSTGRDIVDENGIVATGLTMDHTHDLVERLNVAEFSKDQLGNILNMLWNTIRRLEDQAKTGNRPEQRQPAPNNGSFYQRRHRLHYSRR